MCPAGAPIAIRLSALPLCLFLLTDCYLNDGGYNPIMPYKSMADKTTVMITLNTRDRLRRLWNGEMSMDYVINDILDRLDELENDLVDDEVEAELDSDPDEDED